jgi:superfamily II DNA or RNA helicase
MISSVQCDTCSKPSPSPVYCDCFDVFCPDCFRRHKCGGEHMARFSRQAEEPIVERDYHVDDLVRAMPPREGYQTECIESSLTALAEPGSKTLIVKPTGTGKTVTFSHIARRWIESGRGRVLVMAHRDELIRQAADKISAIVGEPPEIEMGDSYADRHLLTRRSPVVVTSVQTMCRERRLSRFDPNEFGLLITDEAHHATAATYRKVYDHFQKNVNLCMLGVTATPDRTDEEALGQIFDTVAFEYGIQQAIEDGWLVNIEQRFIQVDGLDLDSVRVQAGDLHNADLAKIMELEENLHGIVYPTIEIAGDRPTLMFTSSVAHAERCAEIINRHRPGQALALHGKTDKQERREKLAAFERGEFQYLVNMGLFTEGFDSPRISVVANARPTKSRALYSQIIGRGTRPLPGILEGLDTAEQRRASIRMSSKPAVTVLDFVGNSHRHKLVCTADILGGNYSDDVVELARSKAAKKSAAGEPSDMLEEIIEAKDEIEERAKKKREHVKAKASYRAQSVNPFDVFDMGPVREPGWHKGRKPSDAMKSVLERAKIPQAQIDKMSFCEAGVMISKLKERRDKGLCTYKQAALLNKHGYDGDKMTFDEARAAIDKIAASWRR